MYSQVTYQLWLLLAIVCCTGAQPVTLTSATFESSVAEIPHLVMFYAPWCGHCQRLLPVWDVLSTNYHSSTQSKYIRIAKVDCTQDTPLCSQENILHYPTIKIYNGKIVKRFNGKRSVQTFMEFITTSLNNPQVDNDEISLKQIGSELSGEQLKKVLSTFRITFIKFYAPWCKYCKNLAPTWENLVNDYNHDKDVFIGSINCDIHLKTCGMEQIKSYPTLKIFTDSNNIRLYEGERDLASLKSYIDLTKASLLTQSDPMANKPRDEL